MMLPPPQGASAVTAAVMAAQTVADPAQAALQAGAALGSMLQGRLPDPLRKSASQPTAPEVQGASVGNALRQSLRQDSAPQALAGAQAGQTFLQKDQAQTQGWLQRLQSAAAAAGEDPRALLRETVDGMPVLPPGMTAQQASMYLSHDWPEHRERTAHIVVLISLGMPKSVISNLFEQVVSDPSLREQTLFLMQGWDNSAQGFPKTVSALYRLQPQGKYKVSVAVDPTWFEKLHVREVPAVLVVNEPNMGMIEGDGLSIRDAVARIRARKDLNKTYGQVWRVIEPDPMKELQEKVAHTNWQKVQEQAGARMWQGVAAKSPQMPELRQSSTQYFNPSIVATHTIRLPDGRIVVHKGDLINPLAQPLPWQSLRYISFNADKPWEVRQALVWSRQYPTAKVLMAAPPATTQGWAQLEQAFGKPLFVLEPAVAARLGIQALPSMTWPHGLVLQTYTQGLPAHPRTVSSKEAQP